MNELQSEYAVLQPDDFLDLSRTYRELSDSLVRSGEFPREVYGFKKQAKPNGKIEATTEPLEEHEKPLDELQVLLRLRTYDLHASSKEATRDNVALASHLGSIVMESLYQRAKGQPVSQKTLNFVSKLNRSLFERMNIALPFSEASKPASKHMSQLAQILFRGPD